MDYFTLPSPWDQAVKHMDFAMQPIVNVHSGHTTGVEMLLRGYKTAGFNSIKEVFDKAYEERLLYNLDLFLRELAVQKFLACTATRHIKMFYNLDNRVLSMPDYTPGNTGKILSRYDLHPSTIVFELSERHELDPTGNSKNILEAYKAQKYRMAIDDFGTGFSGLHLLYNSEPDYIKIDRFFIANIADDFKKRLFVTHVINLAHLLGIMVVGEGVESKDEFTVCKGIGCDFVQGYLIQTPQIDAREIKPRYENIVNLTLCDKRKRRNDLFLSKEDVEPLPALTLNPYEPNRQQMEQVFSAFQTNQGQNFFPIITPDGVPLGVIREEALKTYFYSKYGRSLLFNPANNKNVQDFISRCPVAELQIGIEKILDILSFENSFVGLLLTENGHYVGFLSAQVLIRLLHKRNIALAQDQNPLSRLPGNNQINEHIALALRENSQGHAFIYFDFDFFKPFNDCYGFRLGDRAILMFADILKESSLNRFFIGHVGGDDFVAIRSLHKTSFDEIETWAHSITISFRCAVQMLYSKYDRKRKHIYSRDRSGRKRKFPLLRVSAAILYLTGDLTSISSEEIGQRVAELKRKAKRAPSRIAIGEWARPEERK